MFGNKRGVALLQVLIITALLAGMAAMILRASLSRTVTARKARRDLQVQTAIESCMAEVNTMWAAKTPQAYAYDLTRCQMCDPARDGNVKCPSSTRQEYECQVPIPGGEVTIKAEFHGSLITGSSPNEYKGCQLRYAIYSQTDLDKL